tara:strand:+ start:952 stop:1080 length:129 start_codon:yes stop_codon:yes gene_type:complete
MNITDDRLVDEKEAAKYLKVKPSTLRKRRAVRVAREREIALI